jgi:hypothetical protein
MIVGFILGAVVAAVFMTSGLGRRIYDYTSASDYAADYTPPTPAPTYAAPGYGPAGGGTPGYGTEPPADGSFNAQEPTTAYQAPYQAPYEVPAAGYPGAATSYASGAPLNISVVPAPASPGGDNFCGAYALSNRTNQAIVISYADAQSSVEAASDRGVLVQPGETKVHPIAAVNDRQRRQRDDSVSRDDRNSYGDPLYREGPGYESSRDDGSEDRADAATCATIEVKN